MRKSYKAWEDFKEDYHKKSLVNPFVGVNNIFYSIPGNESSQTALSFEKTLGFTDQIIEEYFTDLYAERPMAFAYDEDSLPSTFNRVRRLIQRTVMANLRKYYAALQMYTAEYNPIENYNSTEKETTGLKADDVKVTSTPSGAIKTTSPYITKTDQQNKTTTFDSDVARLNNQSITDTTWQNAGETRTTYENYKTESKNEATNSKTSALGDKYNVGANNQVVDRVLTRAGNIGVTTSQQMLQSEIDLKAYNLIEEFFKDVKEQILLACY